MEITRGNSVHTIFLIFVRVLSVSQKPSNPANIVWNFGNNRYSGDFSCHPSNSWLRIEPCRGSHGNGSRSLLNILNNEIIFSVHTSSEFTSNESKNGNAISISIWMQRNKFKQRNVILFAVAYAVLYYSTSCIHS